VEHVSIRSFMMSCWIVVISLAWAIAVAGQEKPSGDAELDQINAMIGQAWQESDQFIRAGGKEGDPANPLRKWSAILWQYREQHSGSPAAARATSESVHFLVHSAQPDEAIARADTVKIDDPAWKSLIGVLLEASIAKGDYVSFFGKANFLLEHSADREVKVRAQFALARAYWKKEELARSKAAFQKVIAEYPDTPYAKDAEGNIHEIEFLNIGQPVPLFARKSSTGEPISIADFKGKVVLLYFWASW